MKLFNDLPPVLSFYSVSIQKYIGYSLIILFLFILFIGLSIPFYIFILKFTGHFYYFLLFPALFIFIYFKLRKKVFLKNQLKLNLMFLDFLEQEKGEKSLGEVETSEELLVQIDRNMADAHVKVPSSKILLAIQALLIYPGTATAFKKVTWKFRDKNLSRFGHLWVEIMVFLMMLLPFFVISLFLTQGVSFHIQFFIYLLGLMFAFFLNALVFEPIFFLLTLKKLWQELY